MPGCRRTRVLDPAVRRLRQHAPSWLPPRMPMVPPGGTGVVQCLGAAHLSGVSAISPPACPLRDSRLASALSFSAGSRRMGAAFFVPLSPMAKVANGTPPGICTMETAIQPSAPWTPPARPAPQGRERAVIPGRCAHRRRWRDHSCRVQPPPWHSRASGRACDAPTRSCSRANAEGFRISEGFWVGQSAAHDDADEGLGAGHCFRLQTQGSTGV